eukprot:15012115-Heterocapsa_arctica.AAC.1
MPEDNTTDIIIDCPWTYLIALRTILCTMAMAGCYHTAPVGAEPDEEQVLFAPLDPPPTPRQSRDLRAQALPGAPALLRRLGH